MANEDDDLWGSDDDSGNEDQVSTACVGHGRLR